MDPATIMLIGAGAGLGKSMLFDAQREKKNRQLQAATAAYSPWTGMAPQNVTPTDYFGNSMQGLTAAAMYNQNKATNDQNKELLDAQKEQMKVQNELMKKQAMRGGMPPGYAYGVSPIQQRPAIMPYGYGA